LPKPLIEQAGLAEVVDLTVETGRIIVSRPPTARAGWAEAAAEMAERGDDRLLDPPACTRFDQEEWEW
jgi:antitoxin MazE